jgi:hypothetical protein
MRDIELASFPINNSLIFVVPVASHAQEIIGAAIGWELAPKLRILLA